MRLDYTVSQFWNCDEDVSSWIACAVFERVESSDREERVEFYNLFRENGEWKTNDNNEWGNAFVEYVDNYILDSLDIPKSLAGAMLSTVINDLSLRTLSRDPEIAIIADIKTLYTRDEYNHDA